MEIVNTGMREYSHILKFRNIKYSEKEPEYLIVGTAKEAHGWTIHVSALRNEIRQMIERVVPELLRRKYTFKLIKSETAAITNLAGGYGNEKIGKLVTVYCENDDRAKEIGILLADLTVGKSAPQVKNSYHLGGSVFAEYCAGKHINWPFTTAIRMTVLPSTTIANKYYIRSELKTKSRGRVLKALRVSGFSFRNKVLKESLQGMSDDLGRDFSERLYWQRTIYEKIKDRVSVAKVEDPFVENKNTYLPIEYIRGDSLATAIGRIYAEGIWTEIKSKEKRLLIRYVHDILSIVERLHAAGIVHRDLTTENFIISNGTAVLIDLEMAYDITMKSPTPPYALGTNGYMSPEQRRSDTPAFAEDIYALGALLLACFTNLSPTKFDDEYPEDLSASIVFFTGDRNIATIIVRCLSRDPNQRPSIADIKTVIETIKTETNTSYQTEYQHLAMRAQKTSKEVLAKALHAFDSDNFCDKTNHWCSNMSENRLPREAGLPARHFPWFYSGIAGILHILAVSKAAAENAGFNIPKSTERNKKFLLSCLSEYKTYTPGLFYGIHGIVFSLSSALQTKIITSTSETKALLVRSGLIDVEGLSLASGKAGQGQALLALMQVNATPEVVKKLEGIVEVLISMQNNDGSWTESSQRNNTLCDGTAGIVHFLINLFRKNESKSIEDAIHRALSFLIRKKKRAKGKVYWTISDKNQNSEFGLLHGYAGIAMIFAKAYDVFAFDTYKEVALSCFKNFPEKHLLNDLSLETGLSGLGHAYLEGYRLLGDDCLKKKADWIALSLLNTSKMHSKTGELWTMESKYPPSLEVMRGMCGPFSFLSRYAADVDSGFQIF